MNEEINIDNIVDNHYANTPMIDTNEDSEDVIEVNSIPEHLEYLQEENLKMLKELYKGRF
jgi:hypothetical protein